MTKAFVRLITLTGLALLLAGCEKFGGSGREIRFSAISSPGQVTKTAYTGIIPSGATKERIDWTNGDVIRVYSPEAACNNDNSYHWADYNLSGIGIVEGNPVLSGGKMNVKSDDNTRGGLAWTENAGPYTFYGIYPAPSADEATPGTVLGNASGSAFPCTIPAAQMGTAVNVVDFAVFTDPSTPAHVDVYYPPMSNAYMVAQTSASKGTALTTLEFDPAYTAFHIRAGVKSDESAKEIKQVTLTSSGTGSTALAGAYGAYYNSGWNFPITGTDKTITFQFNTDDDADPENYTIASGTTVDFVIFALPQNLTNLTLDFTMGDDTHRSLKLQIPAGSGSVTMGGKTYSAGDWLMFDACQKHYLSGLIVPGSVWNVNNVTSVLMQEGVNPWDENGQNITYGNADPVVYATKLSATSDGYSFSIFSPQGKQWKISVLDAPGGSVASGVTITQTNAASTNTGSGTLTGTIGSPDKVDFILTGASGTYYLSFSIVVDGTEYSINSELYPDTGGVPTSITL